MTRQIPWLRIVAESAAIIASILLAFWIDAWWQETQESALGADYERRIASELQNNLDDLNGQLQHVKNNLLAARQAAAFFDGDRQSVDGQQLIIDLYNMGRDPPDRFDIITYEDLVATGRLGLIRGIDRRQAIQIAYSEIRELEPILQPYRREYLTGVRGWIPQPLIAKIRDVCPNFRSTTPCTNLTIDIGAAKVEAIVERFTSADALLAYRLREQALFEKRERTRRTITAVENAIALLK